MPQYWIVIDRENLTVGEKIRKLLPGTTEDEARIIQAFADSDAKLLVEVNIAMTAEAREKEHRERLLPPDHWRTF